MPKYTANELAERWAQKAQTAGQDIAKGVMKVKEAPGQKAAQKKQKLVQNWMKAVNDGKWERNVAAVTLQDWQRAMTEKGVPRHAAGVQAAQGKFARFAQQLNDHQDAIKGELAQMPDLTIEDSARRMLHNMRRMSEFKPTK